MEGQDRGTDLGLLEPNWQWEGRDEAMGVGDPLLGLECCLFFFSSVLS